MKGVIIRKISLVHEDERRSLNEIFNGEISVRNMKILKVKKGDQILGNYWHMYPEVMYMMKGKAEYKLRNVITDEKMDVVLEEGDVLIKTGFITHTGKFSEDSVVIDGSAEMFVSNDYNHFEEILMK